VNATIKHSIAAVRGGSKYFVRLSVAHLIEPIGFLFAYRHSSFEQQAFHIV
jgi:hypothetical protein